MDEMENRKNVSASKQCKILTERYFKMLIRNPKKLIGMFGFPVIAVIIVVFVAGEDMFANYEGTNSALFLITSAAIWGGMFNSIQEICKERGRLKREYMLGQHLSSYMLSKVMVQVCFCLIQSAVLCFAFFFTHLKYDHALPDKGVIIPNIYVEYYITIFLLMCASDAMGLCISAMLKNADIANAVAPYVLIGQLVFSGMLFKLKGAANVISYAMVSRWSMEALGSSSRLNDLPLRIQATIPSVPHEFDKIYESTAGHIWKVWVILLVFAIGFEVVGTVFLQRVKHDGR